MNTPGRWRVPANAELALRSWGDEVLVHHALANDTHCLPAWSGRLLSLLQHQGAQSAEALSATLGIEAEALEQALRELARLDLLEFC